MHLLFFGPFLIFLLAFQKSIAQNAFDLVEIDPTAIILNYNVTLPTNGTQCINVTGFGIGTSPTVEVSVISTNTVHKIYDISFTFFPSRQVIGGVAGFSIYKNATVIARYPEPEWSRQYPYCKSTTLDTPTLRGFNEICLGNTCGAGTCLDSNHFWGQIKINGYTSNDYLTENPVVSECGNPTVGNVEYSAYRDSGESLFDFEVSVNQSEFICSPTFSPTYLNGRQNVGVTANLSLANQGDLSHFAVQFLYPTDNGATEIGIGSGNDYQWPNSFSGYGATDETCYGATVSTPTLVAGFNQVCIGNTCTGPYCSVETYTGTITVHGQFTPSQPDWVGTVPQPCTQVIHQPTHAPTKDPPVTRGDVAAIILISTLGLVIFVFIVYALVVAFRHIKRRNGFEGVEEKPKEEEEYGCTWAGW